MRVSHAALWVPVTFGLLILAWEFVIQAPRHSVSSAALVFVWCAIPFVVSALIGLSPKLRVVAVGAASASLLTTLYGHYVFFLAPGPSSDTLGLVFMPLWNLFIVGPAGGVAAWLLARFRR